jgi:heptosyltransferase-2/heptosyltransferase-3
MPDIGLTVKRAVRGALLRLTNPRLIFATSKSVTGEVRRIAVVRPDHLGDLLFATPALERIREAFPEAHITGMVGPWGRAMWQGNPNLDALVVVRFPGMVPRQGGGVLSPYRLLNATARKLSAGKYDLGIVLRFDHWWGAAMLAAAGVPRRWGYNTPGMKAWLTNAVPYAAGKHEVEQNLALVERVIAGEQRAAGQGSQKGSGQWAEPMLPVDRATGLPALRPPQGEPFRDELLGPWLAAPRRAVIHPGTAAANKLWTVGGWAEVARNLLDRGWAIAITGSPDETRLASASMDAIRAAAPAGELPVNLAGRTANLGQLVWVLSQAGMVLGVDNGPLHIADALGKPSLHLYGPSDETIWGPWGDPKKHRAFRAPGTRPTMRLDTGSPEIEGGPEMRRITVGMVKREIDLLAGNNS